MKLLITAILAASAVAADTAALTAGEAEAASNSARCVKSPKDPSRRVPLIYIVQCTEEYLSRGQSRVSFRCQV